MVKHYRFEREVELSYGKDTRKTDAWEQDGDIIIQQEQHLSGGHAYYNSVRLPRETMRQLLIMMGLFEE